MMLATIACLAPLGNSAYLLSRALREDRGEPARVRETREIATFVAQATEPGDGIFLYRFQGLDVFYLSGRISNNGIYMFIDMFPEHIRDVEIVATRQRMFLEHLPRILVRDAGGLLLGGDSAEPFLEAFLEERYCLRRRFGEVEIHELCDDGPGQLRSGTGYDSLTENPRSGSCEADPSGSARSSS